MACSINRSSTVGMPSRRVPPFAFGMSTAFTASGRYRPSRICRRISSLCVPTSSAVCATVLPSTPAAPALVFTRAQASFRFSANRTSSNVTGGFSSALIVFLPSPAAGLGPRARAPDGSPPACSVRALPGGDRSCHARLVSESSSPAPAERFGDLAFFCLFGPSLRTGFPAHLHYYGLC
jgi:hypothetical protein